MSYFYNGFSLEIEVEEEPGEASNIYHTLVKPDGTKESIDFTSYGGDITYEAFCAIVILNNPKRKEAQISVPWNNESIIVEMFKRGA